MVQNILITGGCGFIGSALIRYLIKNTEVNIINVDKLTYAGDEEAVNMASQTSRYRLVKADIVDFQAMQKVFAEFQPTQVMHLAAESHVDRSISGPGVFVQTNIVGTYNLLECARDYYQKLKGDNKNNFRFLHISTDEVFGYLGETGYFSEATPYHPSSPYSASKAASDHLVRAWCHTFSLPILITNCSNNYGPWQFPEKLIPVIINNAINGKPLPVYGKGDNIRDWIFVDDHVKALWLVLNKGCPGDTYLVGSKGELTNLQVVHILCEILDELQPHPTIGSYKNLITFVTDRPGHDFRYAIDASKIMRELGWKPSETVESGFRKTVTWYLEHRDWMARLSNKNK